MPHPYSIHHRPTPTVGHPLCLPNPNPDRDQTGSNASPSRVTGETGENNCITNDLKKKKIFNGICAQIICYNKNIQNVHDTKIFRNKHCSLWFFFFSTYSSPGGRETGVGLGSFLRQRNIGAFRPALGTWMMPGKGFPLHLGISIICKRNWTLQGDPGLVSMDSPNPLGKNGSHGNWEPCELAKASHPGAFPN